MVVYKFVNPNEKDALEQEAVKKWYSTYNDKCQGERSGKATKGIYGSYSNNGRWEREIPFFQPGAAMEYALSTAIKKLSVVDKPSIALIRGHGEPALNEVAQVYSELSVLYKVQELKLTDTSDIPKIYKTIANY